MTAADGAVRIINLTGSSSKELTPGKSWTVKPGVKLTFPAGEDHLMIELLDTALEGRVFVEDEPVFDLAAIAATENFSVDGDQFIFLDPFGVYIRQDVDNASRREQLGFLTLSPDQSEKPQSPLPGKKPRGERGKPTRSLTKTALRAAVALFALAGVGLFGLQHVTATIEQAQTVAEEENAAAEAHATPKESENMVTTTKPDVPTTILPSPPEPETQPEATPTPATPMPTPVIKKADVKPRVAKEKLQKRKPARWQKPAQLELKNKPLLTADQEKQYREMLESYRLEAGFDPEGSMRKLQELSRKVPHGTEVRGEIDRAIRDLRNRL